MGQRQREVARNQAARQRAQRIAVGGALLVILVGAALLLTTRSDDDDGGSSSGDGGVRVSMTDFAFDPDPIVVRRGEPGAIDVVNDGEVAHDLVIGELGKGTPDLAPGTSMVLDLSDQPAGTYRVICDLPGHVEAGMVTELVLE